MRHIKKGVSSPGCWRVKTSWRDFRKSLNRNILLPARSSAGPSKNFPVFWCAKCFIHKQYPLIGRVRMNLARRFVNSAFCTLHKQQSIIIISPPLWTEYHGQLQKKIILIIILPTMLLWSTSGLWTTWRSELQLDYVFEPGFVSLISAHAAPTRSVQKALTASPADVVQAERLVTTP